MIEDLTEWADQLETLIEVERLTLFDRVFVLGACDSTQDAARRLCGKSSGAIVVAGRQLAGKGRLGRQWVQQGGKGIAVTFALPYGRFETGMLSLAAGVAAVQAAKGCLPDEGKGLGLRWPNDLVERSRGRKLAGVLIEAADPLMLVGVGMNVRQTEADWTGHLSGRACSLAELGSESSRLDLVRRLTVRLERVLSMSADELVQEWSRHDTLVGVRAEFACGNTRHQGVVESISPTHEIVVRYEDGRRERLPAPQTSLLRVHG